jgi:DNA-directed RNA polymerase subunit E'/Rpb7
MTSTTGLPKVSLNLGPNYLVESDRTFSAHVFNVTEGIIPEDGLVVSVKATNLSVFDLNNIEVIDGEIVNLREDGFDLRLTDLTTLINLPVAADGEAEGLETASFTLAAGDGYQVNSDLSGGSFNITDTVNEIPFNVSEPNDTIPLAVDSGVSSENPQVTLSGSLDFDIGNRYQNPDGSFTYVDGTEDVDFYKVDLKADDIVAFDVDAVVKGNPAIPDLERDRTQGNVIFRLFDKSGNELAARDLGSGAGELFATSTDPYLEFQASSDGSYYLGLSVFTNGTPYRFGGDLFGDPEQYKERAYNPFVPESGDGDSRGGLDYRGIGEYDLQITLNPENPLLVAPQLDRSNNTPPETVDIAAPGEPTVSLDFISATYDGDDNLISNNLVEGLSIQGSILTLLLETEGEIPEEGILVTINSDTYLRDYFTVRSLISAPFSPGAELIDVVTDDTGRETGVQLRVFQPKTFFPLNARTQLRGELVESETDGPEEATFFLEAGEGYGVSQAKNQITATFYDNPEQAPIPEVIPEVSISITNNELYESEVSETTLKFTLSEPPPEEGVLVYLKADKPALAEFDVLNAEISGGAFPFPNGEFSGFYFKITEQEASINLSVFPNPISEGLQSYNFALQETSLYTINQDAAAINFIVGDNPDSVVEVSLSGEPEVLIESENTKSIHTFDLTAPLPEDGVTVQVNAPNLNEFDLEAVAVTGGEITEVTDTGFLLNINETTATVELPVLSDGEAEKVETANFTLIENSDNYFVNPENNQTTFTIVDIPEQTPAPAEETGPNDTISQAVDLNLNPQNTSATVKGNLFPREDGVERADYRDFSEDVDFYSLELSAGDTVKIDIDSIPFETARFPEVEQRLDSELRLFDADGNEIVRVNNAAAPDEQLHRDPYLEFTAEETGNYYVGISQLGNRNYDPNVERSGSGWIFPEIGVFSGEYELNVELTPGESEPVESTFESIFGTIKVDVIEVEGSNQIVFGGDSDNLIDASINSTGNNRIYSGSGDDTVILGISDRIVGGVGEDKFFVMSGGDNIITGGEGADQFWIATAEIPEAANIITDFTSGEDVLGIAGLGIGFDDLSISQQEDNTLIAANNSELAILQGIGMDMLNVDNFAFA